MPRKLVAGLRTVRLSMHEEDLLVWSSLSVDQRGSIKIFCLSGNEHNNLQVEVAIGTPVTRSLHEDASIKFIVGLSGKVPPTTSGGRFVSLSSSTSGNLLHF